MLRRDQANLQFDADQDALPAWRYPDLTAHVEYLGAVHNGQMEVGMRSTRGTAAVARLNARSEGHHYLMVITGAGLFKLKERMEGGEKILTEPLSLDEFVRVVDGMGPRATRRVTKSDAAFARQLIKKTSS